MAELKPNPANAAWQLPFEGTWPTSVAFLGETRRLAAANRQGEIFLWDLPAEPDAPVPDPFRRLDGHTNGVTHLIATADGKTLISSSLDRTIRIWDTSIAASGSAEVILDAKTREAEAKRGKKEAAEKPPVKVELQTVSQSLEGHRDWINALGMSGDQKRLISGDDSGLVIVWDLAARTEITRWTINYWAVAAALSPDGQTALVSEYRYRRDDFDQVSPSLKLWNVADQKLKLDLFTDKDRQNANKFFSAGLVAAAFSPDGKLLAVGQGGENDTGKVHLLEVESGKLLRTISGHRYGILDLGFTPDGKFLLTSGRDTQVRICQVEDGKELATLGKPRGGQFTDWIHAVALSADERWLAAADISGHVQIWHFPG
jgi:WD40 repeat protein